MTIAIGKILTVLCDELLDYCFHNSCGLEH
jgi:hypothetical protein